MAVKAIKEVEAARCSFHETDRRHPTIKRDNAHVSSLTARLSVFGSADRAIS